MATLWILLFGCQTSNIKPDESVVDGTIDATTEEIRTSVVPSSENNPPNNQTDPDQNQDSDDDGLSDSEEDTLGTNPNNDSDNDGLNDGDERMPMGLAPTTMTLMMMV